MTKGYSITNLINNSHAEAVKPDTGIADEQNVFRCGRLVVNLNEATLTYESTIDISPDNQEIRMLVFLVQHKGLLKRYLEIAEAIKLNRAYKGATNKVVAETVQNLMKKVKSVLRSAGAKPEDLMNLISPKKNFGYKLNCE